MRITLERRDPDAQQQGVGLQVVDLGGARVARARGALKGQVRVDEEMQHRENDPGPRAEAALPAMQHDHQQAPGERHRADRVDDPHLVGNCVCAVGHGVCSLEQARAAL